MYITSCAFAVASSPRLPVIAARKLSIARLSGSTAGARAFRGFEGSFRARLFEIGIPCLLHFVPIFVSPRSYGLTIQCWVTIGDTVGWVTLGRQETNAGRTCREERVFQRIQGAPNTRGLAPILPRIQVGRIVLCPARWRVDVWVRSEWPSPPGRLLRPRCRRSSPASRPGSPLSRCSCGAAAAQPREMDVRHHRDQDRGADDDLKGEGIDPLQRKPVLQDATHDAADQPADDHQPQPLSSRNRVSRWPAAGSDRHLA